MIIGLTGTLGAGKGTVVEYLKAKGFKHFSARDFIVEEINHRGLPINRDTMTETANDLRKTHSPSYIVRELYEKAKAEGGDSIIESIRTPGEIKRLKRETNFFLIAIDADRKTRYERIHKRGSATDNISYEEFVANEEREYRSTDPNKQNLSACINAADFTLQNDGSIEDLRSQIDIIFAKIKK